MGNEVLFVNIFIICFIYVILFLSMFFINDFKGNGRILFGISIPKEYVSDSRIVNLKNKYKLNISISSAVLFFIGLIFINSSMPLTILILVFGSIITSTIFYFLGYKKLKGIKENENWSNLSSKKVYVSMNNTREENLLNLWWFLVPIAFALINLAVILININSLPETIILHIGFNGPDSFGSGSDLSTKLEILMLPFLNILIVGMNFFAIKNQIKQSDRLNGGTVEEAKTKTYKSKKQTIVLTFIITLVVSIMMTILSLYCIKLITLSLPVLLITSMLPVLILLVAMPILIRSNHKKEVSLANASEEDIYIDDDNPYKFGGLFYYNKNNPSTWVPKRMGIGYTVNFATSGGKLFIILILSLIIVPLIIGLL
ncbi:MAG: DUF5808 domain-containing protein [Sarcina sp.]